MATLSGEDRLLNCLAQTKTLFWAEHSDCSQDEIQRLWERRRAEIFATLDSPLSPATSTPPCHQDLPATPQAPPMEHLMRRNRSATRYKRPTPVNVPMTRNITIGTTTSCKRPTPSDAPIAPSASIQERPSPIWDYQTLQNEEPWNLLSRPSKMRRVDPGHNPLPVYKISTPSAYVKRSSGELQNVKSSFTMRAQATEGAQPCGGLLTTAFRQPMDTPSFPPSPANSPSTPLTDASTIPTEMSRDISLGSQFYSAMEDVHISSSSPRVVDLSPGGSLTQFIPSPTLNFVQQCDAKAPVASGSQFENQLDLALDTSFQENLPPVMSFEEEVALSLDDDLNHTDATIDSIEASLESRRRRSMEQLARSERPLLPKQEQARQANSKPGAQTDPPKAEANPAERNDKRAITKLEKPQQHVEKLMCPDCNEHSKGFRGPHELMRHCENRHRHAKTKWVCIDNSPDRKMLAGCKNCIKRKEYNAYYNAAAHIRRHHARAAGGRSGAGSSGGDFPPMDVIKNGWLEEVRVTIRSGTDSKPMPTADDSTVALSATPDTAEMSPNVGTNFSETPTESLDFSQDFTLDDTMFKDFFDFGVFSSQDQIDP